MRCLPLALVLFSLVACGPRTGETAYLSGRVLDVRGGALADAGVTLLEYQTVDGGSIVDPDDGRRYALTRYVLLERSRTHAGGSGEFIFELDPNENLFRTTSSSGQLVVLPEGPEDAVSPAYFVPAGQLAMPAQPPWVPGLSISRSEEGGYAVAFAPVPVTAYPDDTRGLDRPAYQLDVTRNDELVWSGSSSAPRFTFPALALEDLSGVVLRLSSLQDAQTETRLRSGSVSVYPSAFSVGYLALLDAGVSGLGPPASRGGSCAEVKFFADAGSAGCPLTDGKFTPLGVAPGAPIELLLPAPTRLGRAVLRGSVYGNWSRVEGSGDDGGTWSTLATIPAVSPEVSFPGLGYRPAEMLYFQRRGPLEDQQTGVLDFVAVELSDAGVPLTRVRLTLPPGPPASGVASFEEISLFE